MATIRRYEDALIAGDFQTAWNLLAPFFQQLVPAADWADSWGRVPASSRFDITGTEYVVEPPDLTWTRLIPSYTAGMLEDIAANADRSRAFGIIVNFTESESASAGRQDFIVAPLLNGDGWRIWVVH